MYCSEKNRQRQSFNKNEQNIFLTAEAIYSGKMWLT